MKLKIRFLKLLSGVCYSSNIYSAIRDVHVAGLSDDAVILKAGQPLIGINNLVYAEVETATTIDESKWVNDFLPVLGLGTYMIIELPLPGIPELPKEALNHFVFVINSLHDARRVLYQTLIIGPPLIALRNAHCISATR